MSALEENQIVKYDTKYIFYSNLAETLLIKLPKPPNGYTINSDSDYYRKLTISNSNWFQHLKMLYLSY